MKPTTKFVGTGFTTRKITTYSVVTDEDMKRVIDELPKRAAGSRHPFLDYLDALEANAREELRRHGLPDELVGYCKDGEGGWVKADDERRPRRGVRYSSLEVVIREAGFAHDTAPGYAERMLRLIADLKDSAADPVILNRAFELGDLARECRLAFVVKGRSRPGGKNRGKSNADRNVEMAREFNKLRPTSDLGETALAMAVAAKWARKNKAKPLGRSAADAAVKAGNRILSGVRPKPDE